MKRFLFILLILSELCLNTRAQDRSGSRLFVGTEWGIGALMASHDDQVFITEDGFIVDIQHTGKHFHARGNFLLFGGYRLSKTFDISVYTGIEGLALGSSVYPAGVRLGLTFPEHPSHGLFMAAAAGIPHRGLERTAKLFKCGYSHNIDIGYGTSLRFLLSGKLAAANPEIYDFRAERIIPDEDVRKSDSIYAGMDISIALVF